VKFETTLQNSIYRTTNVLSYRFPRPATFLYKPGQYFFVTIKHEGKELTHPFSFSSSPTEQGYIEFTKKLSDSAYTAALRTMQTGDWARIDGPYGQFTFEGEYQKIALLGGGIGITPFRSIYRYAIDKDLKSQITRSMGVAHQPTSYLGKIGHRPNRTATSKLF